MLQFQINIQDLFNLQIQQYLLNVLAAVIHTLKLLFTPQDFRRGFPHTFFS